MSTMNANLVPNAMGKSHKLGPNITICAIDPNSLLFRRLTLGDQEPTAASSSASLVNRNGLARDNATTGQERHTSAAAGRIPSEETAETREEDGNGWTKADDDAIHAIILNSNHDITVNRANAEASSEMIVFEPAKQYWLFAQCRTDEGRKEVWIPTNAIDWHRVPSSSWARYQVKLNPDRLKGEVETAFRAMGVRPSSLAGSSLGAQAGPSGSVRKRRSVFQNNNSAKRGPGTAFGSSVSSVRTMSGVTAELNDNPAPIAIMAIHDPKAVVSGGERDGLEESILCEGY